MDTADTTDVTALPPLLTLPAEIIHHILRYVPPTGIAAVSASCQLLRQHSLSEPLWQPLVNQNLPEPLSSPSPAKSFRDLYIAHHPYWFLPKFKIWYADSEPNGKLLVARYDARRGCIEAYAVVAERGLHTFELWQYDESVAIHSFNPRIQLDLNQPVLKLDIGSPRAKVKSRTRRRRRSMSDWFNTDPVGFESDDDDCEDRDALPPLSREVLMDTSAPAGLYTSFMLSRDHPPEITSAGTAVWPPLRIPAYSRTRNASVASFAGTAHRPRKIDEVSEHTFRIRKWIEFSSRQTTAIMTAGTPEQRLYAAINHGFSSQNILRGIGGHSVRMGEDVATYGTLPEWCYTPTAEKPWRGIWCGDYSGHGCEFLLVLQPDEREENPLPEGVNGMLEWLRTGRQRRQSGNSIGALARRLTRDMQPDTDHDEDDDDDEFVDVEEDMAPTTASPSEAWTDNDTETESQYDNVDDGFPGSSSSTGTPTAASESAAGLSADASGTGEYSGRIEAVKLTGDINIPRGEYTFIAPDISDAGLVRIAEEDIFKGARVVRSAGHIAGRGFVHDEYMPSQLILISHNRLAQYWEGFGHVSFYQRVDIEGLLKV